MEKRLVLRGSLAGLVGGVLAFVFARIFAEPKIQAAIDYESARDAVQDRLDRAAGLHVAAEHGEVFSRTVQSNVGLGVGLIAFGAAVGTLYGIAYTVCLGRVGNLRPRSIALLLAAGSFLALYLVPFVKYPANPPAIGHPDTIKQRTVLYLVMVVASVVLLIGAVWLGQWLRGRFGTWTASLLAGAAFVVAIGIVIAALPAVGELSANREVYGNVGTETPPPLRDASGQLVFPGFPADVLFMFRFYSVGAQLLLWTVIGLVFAPLADRVVAPVLVPRTPAADVPA